MAKKSFVSKLNLSQYVWQILAIIAVIILGGLYLPTAITLLSSPWIWITSILATALIVITQDRSLAKWLAIPAGGIPWYMIYGSAIQCSSWDIVCRIAGIFLFIPRLLDLMLGIGIAYVLVFLLAQMLVRD